MVWLRFMAYQPCLLFNAKSSLYIYIRYIYDLIWFDFNGISTIVDYLIPNYLYIYIFNICDLLGFYGTSNLRGYLILNPIYTYILNIYDL